jgi:YD repeat-containing protein
VSPRRFLGWEPARTTVYEYNDAGRVVRATTTVEPEWSAEDREMADALAEYEAGLCNGCRDELRRTTDPENEGRYIAKPAIRCHRCTASLEAQDVYESSPHPSALMIPIEHWPAP